VAALSVCIINWNTREPLRRCLLSLRQAARSIPLQIIVVDNASSDGSAAMVRREFPEVQLVANETNRGYAAANNQALALARAELVLLLNPDVEVTAQALEEMMACLRRHERAAAVAPRLVSPKGRLQYSCRTFPTPDVILWEVLGLSRLWPRSRIFGKYRMTWWSYNDERPVPQPMASALLARREVLEQLGGFDERFAIFFNDVDLCKRIWEAGWEIWFTPTATVRHEHGASTSQVPVRMVWESYRGFVRFYAKHYRGHLHLLAYWGALALLTLSLVVRVPMAVVRSWGRRIRWPRRRPPTPPPSSSSSSHPERLCSPPDYLYP
jgi:N-acetylglucosaminyl-diphospho-decaprenol L-rhamnosyltransferase